MSYMGAKAEFMRRVHLDRDVAVLFRMLQCPQFNAIASKHLSDVGMEGRDRLDKLGCFNLTTMYYHEAVIRDINEENMVRHVSCCVTLRCHLSPRSMHASVLALCISSICMFFVAFLFSSKKW